MRRIITAIALLTGLGLSAPARAQDSLPPAGSLTESREGANVIGAVADSLMIEHGWRVAFQEKTRRELGGPFWRDYRRSVRIPKQSEDTDRWLRALLRLVFNPGRTLSNASTGRAPWHRDGRPLDWR